MSLASLFDFSVCFGVLLLLQMLGEEMLPDHVVTSSDDHSANQGRLNIWEILFVKNLEKCFKQDCFNKLNRVL